jgi:hypothetical protein
LTMWLSGCSRIFMRFVHSAAALAYRWYFTVKPILLVG